MVLFDANVFIDIAKSELNEERSEELEKVIRENHYVIKSTRLLRHYAGAIYSDLAMNAEPFIRTIVDKLENRRPKLTKKINDRQAARHRVGFRVDSDDRFLYCLAIEAKKRSEVLFISNDPAQTQNGPLMQTCYDIPIIDSVDYILHYCKRMPDDIDDSSNRTTE